MFDAKTKNVWAVCSNSLFSDWLWDWDNLMLVYLVNWLDETEKIQDELSISEFSKLLSRWINKWELRKEMCRMWAYHTVFKWGEFMEFIAQNLVTIYGFLGGDNCLGKWFK